MWFACGTGEIVELKHRKFDLCTACVRDTYEGAKYQGSLTL